MNGLLVNLRNYHPRQGRDSLENFVTEILVWVLKIQPVFQSLFLRRVKNALGLNAIAIPDAVDAWDSQYSLGSSRPDMVAKWSGHLLIFEHKVWSPSDEGQIIRYRDLAARYHPDLDARIVLIVPHDVEFQPRADACLRWLDVYQCLIQALDDKGLSDVDRNWLNEFAKLLEFEGLGPQAPVSKLAIRYYPVACQLPDMLYRLFNLVGETWRSGGKFALGDDFSFVSNGSRWGRVGLLLERKHGPIPWAPAIGLCVVINGRDHGISHRIAMVMRLQIVVSFEKTLHEKYPGIVDQAGLLHRFNCLAKEYEWEFYNHRDDRIKSGNNFYHPYYLEIPLADVLSGGEDLQTQAQLVLERATPVIEALVQSKEFRAVMDSCDEHEA